MTGSPIVMQMPGELLFTASGKWLHDGEEVTHKGVYRYFCKHLRYDASLGEYVVEVQGKCVVVKVEDAPFIARSIKRSETSWTVVFNDDEEEDFSASQLRAQDDGALYYERSSRLLAKLTSPAIQALQPYISEDGGLFQLQLPDKPVVTIKTC